MREPFKQEWPAEVCEELGILGISLKGGGVNGKTDAGVLEGGSCENSPNGVNES